MQTKSPYTDAEFLRSVHVVPIQEEIEDNPLRGFVFAVAMEAVCCVVFFVCAAIFMVVWAAL